MSEVSGSYQSYQRPLSELESDLKEQAARSRENNAERIKDLEAAQQDSLRSQEDGYQKTVQDIRDRYDSQLEDQKRQYQSQLEDQRYDRFGRTGDSESRELKQQVRELQDELKARDVAYDRRVGETEDNFSRRLGRTRDEYNRELEQTVQNTRDSAAAAVQETTVNGRERHATEKARLEEMYSDRIKDFQDQLFLERKRSKEAVEDIQDAADHARSVAERGRAAHDERAGVLEMRQREADTAALAASHEQETRSLRDQLKAATVTERDIASGVAQGRAEVIAQTDDENRRNLTNIQDGHERELARAKAATSDVEHYLDRLYTDKMRGQEANAAGHIRDANVERYQETARVQSEFDAALKQRDIGAARDRAAMQRSTTDRLQDAARQRDNALHAQAETNREVLQRQSIDYQSQLRDQRERIRELENPKDVADVPPAAADAIRAGMAGEYQKTVDEDAQRNRRALDRISEEMLSREETLMRRSHDRERQLTQRSALDMSQETAIFNSHIQDTEASKREAIQTQQVQHDRELDKLMRVQARLLDEQKRRYDEILDQKDRESEAKFTVARQEAEFQLKNERRENAQQRAEISRSYEKMLSDQKEEFQIALADVKRDADAQIRETQRQSKEELERQRQEFDQRMAQTESTYKGRERSVAASYEEQLENVRRANARVLRERSERA